MISTFLTIFHHMCLLRSNLFTLCYFWQKCYHWVMLQWYLWTESYFRLLSLHFPAICQRIPGYRHFWPFCTICACLRVNFAHLCLYKNIFTGCCCSDTCKKKANPGYHHPIFPPLAWKLNFLAIFGHFSPIVPAHGPPVDPTSAFTEITIITECCCNDIYGERATPDHYHSIFPW